MLHRIPSRNAPVALRKVEMQLSSTRSGADAPTWRGATVGNSERSKGPSDPQFQTPYVDVDEWRDEPVRHRYVHGGFEDTELRFSYYFPPEEHYDGRFFQPILAVPGTETLLRDGFMSAYSSTIEFGAAHGAYMVESNLGLLTPYPARDGTLAGYILGRTSDKAAPSPQASAATGAASQATSAADRGSAEPKP